MVPLFRLQLYNRTMVRPCRCSPKRKSVWELSGSIWYRFEPNVVEIYLAGIGGAGSYASGTNSPHFNPKLCYSNVNLSTAPEDDSDAGMVNDVSRPHAQQSIAVNVAAPFYSPLLFDAMGQNEQQQYSLCVADDTNLRLGVIDDIQKLHVTTCRLGMAPRRIVHCPDGRLFAVGCIESGIKEFGLGGGEMNMGNLVRFLDDTTLDDIDRYVPRL
jgi:DNA damage-binding protein 1